MRCPCRAVLALLLLPLLVAGCGLVPNDPTDLVSNEVDDFAQDYIWMVVLGSREQALEQMAPEVRDQETLQALARIRRALGAREPEGTELVGYQSLTQDGHTRRRLTYQAQYGDQWVLTTVVVDQNAQDEYQVAGINFQPLEASLQEIHAFTLGGKTPVHYAFLALGVLFPLLSLWALARCFGSDVDRKWLWLVFIALGLGKVSINWTTGEVTTQLLSVQLLSAMVSRTGFYGAWTIAISAPVGAFWFLVRSWRSESSAASVEPPREAATTEPAGGAPGRGGGTAGAGAVGASGGGVGESPEVGADVSPDEIPDTEPEDDEDEGPVDAGLEDLDLTLD